MTGADYVDGLALLANTPAYGESLQLSLKQAAGSIGLYENANKTDFMRFEQKETTST